MYPHSSARRLAASGPAKVLVIDDVEATRTGLAQLLRLRGYETQEAVNGEDGLRLLRQTPGVRVVILDLLMGGTNGYWFREQQLADAALKDIPVVVFTGVSGTEEIKQRLRIDHVLSKPVSVDQLFEVVQSYCRDENEPRR